MNRVIFWDSTTGIMSVEPGVTIQQALKICLKDNWILPVVPGTRFPTIGGCTANNVHGKNSFKDGNFGDWVLEFDILFASNEILACSRKQNSDMFYAAIGGIGMLGIFTQITIQLKKIPSTNLLVRKWTVPNLETMIEDITASTSNCDYVIGQIDCFRRGNKLGRGTIHAAVHSSKDLPGDRYIDELEISGRVFSVVPASWILEIGKIFMGSLIMRLISSLKYYADFFNSEKDGFVQSLPQFNFLLDRIPEWPRVFKNGFYEFEPLIPKSNAYSAIKEIICLSHQYEMPPYLSGIKLHAKDDFLLSYSLDGLSVGFDFPVLPRRANVQKGMFFKMHEIVANQNGLIYPAKDNLVNQQHFKKMYNTRVDEFLTIKEKYDPDMLFQSNLFCRLFLNSSTI